MWRVVFLLVLWTPTAWAQTQSVARQETRTGLASAARQGGVQGSLYLVHRSWLGWTFDEVDAPTTLERGSKLGVGLEVDASLQASGLTGPTSLWGQGEARLRLQAPIVEVSPVVAWQRRTRVEDRHWRPWRDQMGVGFEARASFESLSLLEHPFHLAMGGHTFRAVERRSILDGSPQGADFEYEFDGFMYAFDGGREPEVWRVIHLQRTTSARDEEQWLSDMRVRFLSFEGVRWGALAVGASAGIDVLEMWGSRRDDTGFGWRLSVGQRTHLARDPFDPRGSQANGLAWRVSVGSLRRLDASGERVDAGWEGDAHVSWRPHAALGVWALGFAGAGRAVARVGPGTLGDPMTMAGLHAGVGWQPDDRWMVRAMGLLERSEREELWLGVAAPGRVRAGARVALERRW